MKQNFKRFLSIVLTCVMLVGMLPVSAFAAEADETTPVVETPIVVETTAPETTAPETTAPETTVPETTVPETTVPETTVPETTVPETTVPETTVPETTVPETTVPETTVPETTVPETTVPETTVPEETVPEVTVAEDPVKDLYDTLMAFETYEALGDYMDAMTEEQYALMDQFSDEQNNALFAKIDQLLGNDDVAVYKPGDNGPGGNSDVYDHIDVRQEGPSITMTYVTKNLVTGEVLNTRTVTIDCTVTGITSVAYTQLKGTDSEQSWTWTSGFTGGSSGYEFRKTGLALSKDLSGSYATIVVDLTSKDDGTVYEDVTFTFGPSGCQQAVYDCDGYNSGGGGGGGSVGLDFILGVNNDAEIKFTDWVIPVRKIWDDNNNQDGIRPASVQVQLKANGTAISGKVATLNAANNWYYEFQDMDAADANGNLITYTIDEVTVPEGYEKSVDNKNFTVTNSHTPEVIDKISGSKTWDDNNNQDGIRPTSITVNLLADGDVIETITVTEEDGWAWSFENLPKYAAGKEIVYSVSEVKVDGYTTTVSGMDITNTHIPEKTFVSGEKTWDDANNQDGIRPASITVNLMADGVKVKSQTVSAGADGKWTYTFTDVDKYADGKEIIYTVSEEAVTGYTAKVSGMNITNTHTPEKTSVKVTKVWDDENNLAGFRTDSVTVQLKANGAAQGDAVVLNVGNNWTNTWNDLDKFAGGKEIVYTVEEINVPSYYTAAVSGDSANGFTITNTHIPERINLSVEKKWDDEDNRDGIRPETITVKLLANGAEVATAQITAANGWKHTFEGFVKYANGQEIEYAVEEVDSGSYTATYKGLTITNKYTPKRISVSGSKIWDDNDNQDGKRPESITINLMVGDTKKDSKTVTAADDWKWSFTDLYQYENGAEIQYTITEDKVDEYEDPVITGNKTDGFVVTNKHKIEKTSVSGAKTWDDNNNQDGKRPESITIRLLADGTEVSTQTVTEAEGWKWSFTNLDKYAAGEEITYTIKEDTVEGYTAVVNGFNVTNTHEIEKTSVSGEKTWVDNNDQDGKRPESITIRLLADGTEVSAQTVTEAEGWKWSFTNLDKYAAGEEITYTIKEDTVEGYTAVVNGFNVTNTHEIEKTSVSGNKVWVDSDNQDGIRPTSITVNLLANNVKVDSMTVSAGADGNWSYSFNNLDKYADGEEIIYTVSEEAVEGYEVSISGTTITNTHVPEQTEVSVKKVWDDADNQDGIRPTSVAVMLYADTQSTGKTLVLNEDNNWAGTFAQLDKYRNAGAEIIYTVAEASVPGYTPKITGDAANGYTVTNIHEPEQTSVSVTKLWDDADNQDGIRPESVTVMLKKGDEILKTASVSASADGSWTYTFTELDKFENGVEIVYTVAEAEVAGYTASIEGNVITNSHTPELIDIPVIKVWDDANDQDGLRSDDITVMLLADGNMTGKSLNLSDSNEWTDIFEDLPKYRDGGIEIDYTVDEIKIDGYKVEITGDQAEGYTITNTHIPETTAVEGTKTWIDDEDRDGLRPESITINLVADGKIIETVEVTEEDGWVWSFNELPVYRDHGTKIVYEITEEAVEGYETVVDGFSVTNTHEIATTEVKGAKTWNDDNDRDGLRPESITISLLADGQAIETIEVAEEDGWAWSFEELPVYRDQGTKIVYTVAEAAVEGYETVIEGFDITNTHEIATTEVKGAKTWDDANNQDGKRPASITINLVADGETIETIEVTEAEGWAWSFTELPVYKDHGVEIVYAITENAVEGYATTYDGYNVTNTHTPEETSITVTKAWADSNNAEGIRPGSVTIRLMANGVFTGLTLELDAQSKWVGSFTGLPKYFEGELVEYTVDEVAVKGYTTVIKGNMEEGFTVTNTHVYIPQTGDDRTPMMWITMMAVSAMMIALASIDSKKRRNATK